MLIGSKMADSMTTSRVSVPISDWAPPITPAMPIGPSGSAMISVSGVRLADEVVERLEALPRARPRTEDAAVVDGRGIEVWIGLPSSSIT